MYLNKMILTGKEYQTDRTILFFNCAGKPIEMTVSKKMGYRFRFGAEFPVYLEQDHNYYFQKSGV